MVIESMCGLTLFIIVGTGVFVIAVAFAMGIALGRRER